MPSVVGFMQILVLVQVAW